MNISRTCFTEITQNRTAIHTYPATHRSGKVLVLEDYRLSSNFPWAGSFDFCFLGVLEDNFIVNAKENVTCLEV